MQPISRARHKWLRSLHSHKGRLAESAFIAEGVRLIRDAVAAGNQPILVVVEEGSEGLLEQLPPQIAETAVLATSADYRAAADTVTSQGLLAAFALPDSDWLRRARPHQRAEGAILICDNVRDPGNLGTLLRSAVAFGCAAAVLTKGCADPFSPKVVRSAMGANFALQFDLGGLPDEIAEELPAEHSPIWVLDAAPTASQTMWPPAPEPRPAIVIGGETEGPSPEWAKHASGVLHIPQSSKIDSLNAAMAGTLALGRWYEARNASRS